MICYNFAKIYTVDDAKGTCNSNLYISILHAGELVCSTLLLHMVGTFNRVTLILNFLRSCNLSNYSPCVLNQFSASSSTLNILLTFDVFPL